MSIVFCSIFSLHGPAKSEFPGVALSGPLPIDALSLGIPVPDVSASLEANNEAEVGEKASGIPSLDKLTKKARKVWGESGRVEVGRGR